MSDISVFTLQAPLRRKYVASPDTALVVDCAVTSSANNLDPFHATVEPMEGCGIKVPVGVHSALGGVHDAPTPGDLLCAALAACQDSSIRMVANILGVELEHLQVKVTAQVDVRGALAMSQEVPVGFQCMKSAVKIRVKDGTAAMLVEKLKFAAERSCVVLQTLRNPPPIEVQFDVSQ